MLSIEQSSDRQTTLRKAAKKGAEAETWHRSGYHPSQRPIFINMLKYSFDPFNKNQNISKIGFRVSPFNLYTIFMRDKGGKVAKSPSGN